LEEVDELKRVKHELQERRQAFQQQVNSIEFLYFKITKFCYLRSLKHVPNMSIFIIKFYLIVNYHQQLLLNNVLFLELFFFVYIHIHRLFTLFFNLYM
jgi:DNA-binding helix-hairpin-helix protein with protein kinase domain